ncbi:MAG: L,D-transpeptidase family protein [Ferruginibacter sp.]
MKKIFLASAITFFLISCNNNNQDGSTSESKSSKKEKAENEKKVSKRDFTIIPANAYNNLFLDSNAMVEYFSKNNVSDAISRRMRSFYNARNYQYAWFSGDGLTEQARGFWNMHNYQTTYGNDTSLRDKGLQKYMDYLIAEEELTVTNTNKNILNTEFKLTEHYILYALNNIEDGFIKRKEMERFIPRKKENAFLLADSLLTKKHKDNKYYEDVNETYKSLKQQLGVYYTIVKKGGWPVITANAKQLKKGTSSPYVLDIKKRLQATGDMPAGDTSQVFTDSLSNGIASFQKRHGYTPTGVITDQIIKDMNVPAEKRLQQILINMGRMQWMINEPKGQMIVVNIPEFILHVKNGKQKVFDMNVVVGKEGHNTMMFTGNLNQVVFSPYWNVPSSIVQKEIMPAINRNANYLENNNMEIVGNDGSLPVVRQLPGPKNSLGKVKFLFPNSFNIYFHDTPAKSLFEKDKRAYSHGCIRLSDPTKMANYLLQDDAQWGPEAIDAAMNSGTEKFVKLKKAIPVLITYYTAWVDDEGLLHFADDIYGHDKKVIEKMFSGPVSLAKN